MAITNRIDAEVRVSGHSDRSDLLAEEIVRRAVRFDHVVVPLDGSRLALAALATAQALARRFGAEVHTITVGKAQSSRRIRWSRGTNPGRTIAQVADELGSCLVVMSTSARGPIASAVLGSVTQTVVAKTGAVIAVGPVADRPMWMPRRGRRRGAAPLASSEMVAVVDGSARSETVLPVAAAWAEALDMSLTILMFDQQREAVADPANYVHGLAETLRGTTLDATALEIKALAITEPIGAAEGLRLYLDQYPTALVALTMERRSGLKQILRRTEGDKILRTSTVPCLVVPSTP